MNGGTLCIRSSNWNDTLSKVVATVINFNLATKIPITG